MANTLDESFAFYIGVLNEHGVTTEQGVRGCLLALFTPLLGEEKAKLFAEERIATIREHGLCPWAVEEN